MFSPMNLGQNYKNYFQKGKHNDERKTYLQDAQLSQQENCSTLPEMKSMLRFWNFGAKPGSSVTKKTNYLICGEKCRKQAGKSSGSRHQGIIRK